MNVDELYDYFEDKEDQNDCVGIVEDLTRVRFETMYDARKYLESIYNATIDGYSECLNIIEFTIGNVSGAFAVNDEGYYALVELNVDLNDNGEHIIIDLN